jgi:hypothetical protein
MSARDERDTMLVAQADHTLNLVSGIGEYGNDRRRSQPRKTIRFVDVKLVGVAHQTIRTNDAFEVGDE